MEGEGAAMVMGGTGEVHQGILDLSMVGTFTDPLSWGTDFSDPDGGDMGHTGAAIILIIPVMVT